MKIEWKCPKCGADAGEHGRGECMQNGGPSGNDSGCMGFICECLDSGDPPLHAEDGDHGHSLEKSCLYAYCYHCDWAGVFPVKPKGLQAWERKALDAGWTMPEARRKELGL